MHRLYPWFGESCRIQEGHGQPWCAPVQAQVSTCLTATVPCTVPASQDVVCSSFPWKALLQLEAWWPGTGTPKQSIYTASHPPSEVVESRPGGWYLLPTSEQKRHHVGHHWVSLQGSHGKSLAGDHVLYVLKAGVSFGVLFTCLFLNSVLGSN